MKSGKLSVILFGLLLLLIMIFPSVSALDKSGVLSYWNFNNGYNDYYGQNNATPQGNALRRAGFLNNGSFLDGTGDYLNISNFNMFTDDLRNNFTLNCWFNDTVSAISANDRYWNVKNTTGVTVSEISAHDSQNRVAFTIVGGTILTRNTTLGGTAHQNIWVMVSYVWDGTNHSVYVNGTLANTTARTNRPFQNINNVSIGRPDANTLNGMVDECTFWNKPVSGNDLAEIYSWNRNGTEFGDIPDNTVMYLASNGSDSNSGFSPNAPIRTIAHYNTINNGSFNTLLLQRGDSWYAGEDDYLEINSSMLYGTFGNPNFPQPVIYGGYRANSTTNWTACGTNLWCHTVNVYDDFVPWYNNFTQVALRNWTISTLVEQGNFVKRGTNLTIYSTSNPASFYNDVFLARREVIYLFDDTNNVRMENLTGKGTATHVFQWAGEASNMTLRYLRGEKVGGGNFSEALRQFLGNCIEIFGGGTNILIENNTCIDVIDAGYTLQYNDGTDVTASNVTFRNNVCYGCGYGFEIFQSDAGSTYTNITVDHNSFIDNEAGLFKRMRQSSGQTIHERGLRIGTTNNTLDFEFTNNLVVNASEYIIATSAASGFEGNAFGSNTTVYMDYNDLYRDTNLGYTSFLIRWYTTTNTSNYFNLSQWRNYSGKDSHSISENVIFVNKAGGDFRPSAGQLVCNSSSTGSFIGALACGPDAIPTGNITNLSIQSFNNQSIFLFWTNPTDSDFNHTEIWQDGVSITNATGNSYNVTGLESDTSYDFVLRPVDLTGNRGNNASINGTTLANSFTPGGCELTITRFTSQATLFNTTLSNSSRMYNVTFCQKPYIVNATITVQNFNTSNNITLNETSAPSCTGSVTDCANAYDDNLGTLAAVSVPGSGYAFHDYSNIFSHRSNITIYYSCGASASTLSLDCNNGGYLNLFTENAPCGTSFREINLQSCDSGGSTLIFRTFMDAGAGGFSQLIDIIPRYYFAHNITANNLSIHSDYYAGRQTKTINFTSAARNTSSTVMYVNLSYIGNITWQSNITLDIVYNKTINVSIRSASNTSQILNPTCTYNGNTIFPKSVLLNYTSSLSNVLACNASGYSDATFDIVPVSDAFNLTMSSATLFLTILDEETDRQISENVTLTVLSSQSIVNYTVIAGGINISSLPNGEIELRYGSGLYVVRSYFATIASNTSIDLYTLRNTSATLILFYIPDERGNPVFNGTLKMQRQFANRSDIWRTVAMEKIDDNGISGIYLVANDVYYKFLIEKAGVMLATYGPQKVFSSPVTLQAPTLENVLRSLVSVRDSITTSLVWNNVTNVVTYTWNDASGITQQGCLEVFQITAFARQSKASSCGSSASGSIDINTTSFLINATYQARGYIITSTTYSEPITDIIIKVFGRQHDTYGRFGLYAAYLLIGTLFLAGLFFSFSMALIFSGVGMFFAQAIGLAFFGPQLIVTFLIIGFVIAVANRI